MPREFSRSRRIADQIQRELAVLIQRELDRGRVGLITLSAADVSPDLTQAKIYFTSLDASLDERDLTKELNRLAGHFRHSLARCLRLRSMPTLKFVFDRSVERGNRLSSLIDSLRKDSDKS